MSNSKVNRREFVRHSILAGAAVPLAGIPIKLMADGHQVSEDDPSAQALGYKHDATTVDTGRFPKRGTEEGQSQFCDNCQLYQNASDGWGDCGIFPGKKVNGKGWCSAWVPTA